MKKLSLTARMLVIAAFVLAFNQTGQAQLNAGDILFTGYIANATGTDEFSFVTLVSIPSGTTINFTDNGWLATNVFRAGEQTTTLVTSTTLQPGTEVKIEGPSAGAGTATAFFGGTSFSAGTVTGSIPSLATSGDQVIAYRGTVGAPTLLAGIQMNVYSVDLAQCGNTTAAAWDPTCIVDNANFSRLPLGLAPGTSVIWIGTEGVSSSEQDNARFNCTGPLGTVSQVRAAVTNSANWTANSVAPPNFTLPTGCAYLAVTAAEVSVRGRVLSATGRALSNATVTLTDQNGQTRTSRTSSFGYYSFDGVAAGESYTLGARAKGFRISPRLLVVGDEIVDADLVAEP